MRRLCAVLAICFAVTLMSVSSAEARWFEPHASWRNAGATCIASRRPPARRWRHSPPRACVAPDPSGAEAAPAQPVSMAKADFLPTLKDVQTADAFARVRRAMRA
ncbi:MAG: hypothetical protein JNJ73_13915 [Hyphomonadaceae bacterium]|nr:hypothetical protein [Hyphomonadaceae bacterium]